MNEGEVEIPSNKIAYKLQNCWKAAISNVWSVQSLKQLHKLLSGIKRTISTFYILYLPYLKENIKLRNNINHLQFTLYL